MADRPTPVFDGHNDILLKLALPRKGEERTIFERSDTGHLDLPRMREGGFAGGMFSVFVPPGPPPALLEKAPNLIPTNRGCKAPLFDAIDTSYAEAFTDKLVTQLYDIECQSDGALGVVRSIAELRQCINEGIIAVVLHFEGAEAIDEDLGNLQTFYDRGLRSVGPAWSRPNLFAHGVPFEYPRTPDTGPGLTERGFELIDACNRLGILIDLSHINEKGFRDVAKRTSAPLVVTHSAVHSLCRTTRNLTDYQIDAVAESGGVIGVNFHVGDLREGCWEDPSVPVSEIVRHITYLVDRIGVEYVAFGSDFDGATIPQALGDVSRLQMLPEMLRQSGFDSASIDLIAKENWLRVLEKTWRSDAYPD